MVKQYTIDFSEIEKVVGEKAKIFNEEFDKMRVYLRMSESNIGLSFSDFLCYIEGTLGFDDLKDSDIIAYTSLLYVRDLFKDCLSNFEEQFGVAVDVDVYINTVGSDIGGYLTLDLVDVNVDGTSNKPNYEEVLQKLKENGVQYDYSEVEWSL